MNNIQETQEPNKCRHEACICEASDTGDYCSDYCENAVAGDMGAGCQCEHPDCAE